jgi:hypothetical protein
MIKSVKVTNHLGEAITMDLRSPEQSGFFIRNINGLGPSKSIVNFTEVLSSDGAFYNSSRVSSRNVVFDLGFYELPNESIETIRQKTYKFFPMKKEIGIEVETENRVGVTSGYVESNEPDIFSKEETALISVLCPRAFFYSKNTIQTTFSGISGGFQFPWQNASLTLPLLKFGDVYIDTAKSVFYTGDEETGVVVYISVLGPVTNLTVHNATRGQSMPISSASIIAQTGAGLQAGDQIIISTLRGSKYIHLIRGGLTYNILNALAVNADWFRIDRGDNVFTYTADSGLENLQFMIEHRIVYGGL